VMSSRRTCIEPTRQSGWRSGKYLHTHWFDLSQCRDRIHWCVRVKHYRSQWRSRPVARLLPGLLCGSISQLREREERNQEYSCLFCCCNPIARGVLFILLPFFHHACFWLMNKSSKKCLIVMTHSITTKTRDCHSDGRHELGLIWWSLYASITPRFHGILGEGYHMDHLSFVLAQDKGAKGFQLHGGTVDCNTSSLRRFQWWSGCHHWACRRRVTAPITNVERWH
jgi:hypothetical protein